MSQEYVLAFEERLSKFTYRGCEPPDGFALKLATIVGVDGITIRLLKPEELQLFASVTTRL